MSDLKLKLIQEKIGNTLDNINLGNNFMNGIPTVQQLRESIDRWDHMKLKSFSTAKETVTRLKKQPTELENVFAYYHLARD
jgi:hypothetical protein